MKQEKDMVWIAIDKEKNGRNHYRVYESLEDAKTKKPFSEKCKVQIVRKQSKNELRELAEFTCQLMDNPIYYNNEDKLLEDLTTWSCKSKTRESTKKYSIFVIYCMRFTKIFSYKKGRFDFISFLFSKKTLIYYNIHKVLDFSELGISEKKEDVDVDR